MIMTTGMWALPIHIYPPIRTFALVQVFKKSAYSMPDDAHTPNVHTRQVSATSAGQALSWQRPAAVSAWDIRQCGF